MSWGPGKYDDICTEVREKTNAQGGVLLVILDGDKGSGFSCQTDLVGTIALADLLENVARQIREHGIAGSA